jgi:hypothetical protein
LASVVTVVASDDRRLLDISAPRSEALRSRALPAESDVEAVQQVGGISANTGLLHSRMGSGAPRVRSYATLSDATDPDELTSLAMQANWLRSIGFAP